jgi:MoaA/NifB/PqqE/SkfB family radical SAM enzyme
MRVKQIHVEASTYCNARCPLCPRSLYGYKIQGVYPEIHLSVKKFKTSLESFPEREFVYFNGNLGDPMMNPDILGLIDVTDCRTSITTNGSIGSKDTWKQLALKNTEVTFSVDGLSDTNHLYRQDLDWNKILDRMNWFISAGGIAKWKFVVFHHNSHQKDQARALAIKMGFRQFDLVDHGRNYGPALDKDGQVTHWILPEDKSLKPSNYDLSAGIERYKETHHNFKLEEKKYDISCEHLNTSSVYVDARGRVSPCCYQGFDLPNLPFIRVDDFQSLKSTWDTKKCNPTCAQSCAVLK